MNMVEVREVLSLQLNKVRVEPNVNYEMVGVYSFGRGLFEKETVNGTDSSYNFFFRLDKSQLVLSQLFGWEGAIALCPKEFEGKYVSSQFPTFKADQTKIDLGYLSWWARQESVWKELRSKSRGMGDRRRTLTPEALLSCLIPLPSLEIQRKIACRLDKIFDSFAEAEKLRNQNNANLAALLVSMAHRADLTDSMKLESGWSKLKLSSILFQVKDSHRVNRGGTYPHFGVYSYAKGLFKKEPEVPPLTKPLESSGFKRPVV